MARISVQSLRIITFSLEASGMQGSGGWGFGPKYPCEKGHPTGGEPGADSLHSQSAPQSLPQLQPCVYAPSHVVLST